MLPGELLSLVSPFDEFNGKNRFRISSTSLCERESPWDIFVWTVHFDVVGGEIVLEDIGVCFDE